MDSLLPILYDHFRQKEEHLRVFAEVDSRVEGWFKGEMIVLLSRLDREGKVEFKREWKDTALKGGRVQIDFRLRCAGEEHLCELKALCISERHTARGLKFYFRDNDIGILKDMRKLEKLSSYGHRWILAFVYPSPSSTDWERALATLPAEMANWRCITSPKDYPKFAYLALWKHKPRSPCSQ